MYTPAIRIFFIVLNIMMAIVFYMKGYVWLSVLALSSAILFLYGYHKSGTVYIAFQYLKRNNIKKAETLLLKIKSPEKLEKLQKGYYHFVKGVIAFEKKEWDNSFSELTQALQIGLRTKNDTSIVLLDLANVEFERKNYTEAAKFIAKCKEFDLKPLVASELEKLIRKMEVKVEPNNF